LSSRCRIVPAILTDDPQALGTMVKNVGAFATWVQVDIMDGRFVPSCSVTSEHFSGLEMNFGWEVHLMVEHPEEYIRGFAEAGAERIIFHYEATPSPEEVIAKVKELNLKVGLALNPETPVSSVVHLIGGLDSILFLSVHPGFYGQKFLPEVLDKVKELRRLYPEFEIGIDGGIKENNITLVAGSGVDYICVGSAILLSPNPAGSFQNLEILVSGDLPGR